MQRSIPPSLSSPTLYTTTSLSSNANPQLTWEFLRKQARQSETEIEQKLTSYSKLVATAGRSTNIVGVNGLNSVNNVPNTFGNSSEAMELELDELLKKLTLIVNSMAEVLDQPSTTFTNPSMMHLLQRHRDILYDYSKEFKKTKANIQAAKNHADLLSSVRNDISSFKSGASSETDYFLSERGRIENSHQMTDMVLEQAYETREEIGRQKTTLLNINNRMANITNLLPGVNSLIRRINTRKKRDTLILAAIIAACIFLLFLYITNT